MACFGAHFPDSVLLGQGGGHVYNAATPFRIGGPQPQYPVKWIGPFLANQLATVVTARHPGGIHTVGQLRAELQGRSRRVIERSLSQLAANAHPNRCVATLGHRRYHVSLVNTCGFNVLLALVRVHNVEARRIPFRTRGPAVDQGQRWCGCHTLPHCNADPLCQWREGACIPALANPLVASQGFGPDGSRSDTAGQYRRSQGHAPRGRRYVRRWLVPTNPPPLPAPPPPVVPIAHRTRAQTGPRRSNRLRGAR